MRCALCLGGNDQGQTNAGRSEGDDRGKHSTSVSRGTTAAGDLSRQGRTGRTTRAWESPVHVALRHVSAGGALAQTERGKEPLNNRCSICDGLFGEYPCSARPVT